jgi:hypothetical protein
MKHRDVLTGGFMAVVDCVLFSLQQLMHVTLLHLET